ncbi:MAG: hypothetical protein V1838_01035 [Patescibacteria group bacterium]
MVFVLFFYFILYIVAYYLAFGKYENIYKKTPHEPLSRWGLKKAVMLSYVFDGSVADIPVAEISAFSSVVFRYYQADPVSPAISRIPSHGVDEIITADKIYIVAVRPGVNKEWLIYFCRVVVV